MPAQGLLEPGNIDLNNRPIVRNADGTVSTVRSMGVNLGGKEVLIPTVAADGSGILNDSEAIDQYRRTGQHLGVFDTPENSTAYAQSLHQAQAQRYAPAYNPNDYIEPPGQGFAEPQRPMIAQPQMPAGQEPHLLSPLIDWLIHAGKLVPVDHDPFAPEGAGR